MKYNKLINTVFIFASIIILSGCKINQSPSVGAISPSSGSSSPGQEVIFTTTYTDGNGWQDLKDCRLLVNASANIRNSLCARYDQNTGKLYLIKDNNTNEATCWQGGFSPGSANIIENSYCSLDCSKTGISGSGNTLTISWAVTFKQAFLGSKNTYLYAKDDSNATKNWTRKGTWKIQVPPDAIAPTGSIKVNNDTQYTNSRSVTLSLEAQDDAGGSGIDKMQFSNDNAIWSTAEPFASTKTWDLSSGDGTKTVYVKFSDKAGNWSIVYSDTIILDTTAPGPPQGLSYVLGDAAIDLIWSSNVESDFGEYNVYRSTSHGGPYTKINSLPITASGYRDADLISGITYYYVVTASDKINNESGYSQEISVEFYAGITFSSDALIDADNIDYENYRVTVDNCSLTVNGRHTFKKLTLVNGANVTHSGATPASTTGLYLTVDTLTIDSGSSIDVVKKGYMSRYTLGNTQAGASRDGSGGSYGGLGGLNGGNPEERNNVYGDLFNPDELGSGGSENWSAGGGLINIHAKAIILDGAIKADGGMEAIVNGSGGCINITTKTLSGSGVITADGGTKNPDYYSTIGYSGGGGGRIAIFYENMNGFNRNNIHAYGGQGEYYWGGGKRGGAGTIHLKSSSQQYGDLIVDNAGFTTEDYGTPLRSVGKGTITAISTNTLTDDNANFPVPDPQTGALGLKGLKINPDLGQSGLFTIIDNTATTITVDGDLSQVANVGDSYAGVYMLDNLFIKGKAMVSTRDNITVLGAVEMDGYLKANRLDYTDAAYFNFIDANLELAEPLFKGEDITLINAKLTLKDTSLYVRNLFLSQNTVLSHTVCIAGLYLDVDTLTIDATSSIDVTRKGYAPGYTLGNTITGASRDGSGGSYGGLGGLNGGNPEERNNVYGDLFNPDELGSGGSESWSAGGGLVNIRANAIILDGAIKADGDIGWLNGSGGCVNIVTKTLSGSGRITADGGAKGPGSYWGASFSGGGGGRIAIYYEDMSGFSRSNIHCYGGGGVYYWGGGKSGGAGTIYLKSLSQEYGDLIIDNAGLSTEDYGTPLRSIGKGIATAISANTLTNINANFPVPDPQTGSLGLKGMKINPNLKQSKLFTIIDNTATTITVDGDIAQVANAGDSYAGVYVFDNVRIVNGAKVFCDDYVVVKGILVKDNGGEMVMDLQPPVAEITSPAPNSDLSGVVTISGSAHDDHFGAYVLEYGEGTEPNSWTIINNSRSPVFSGVLGTLDTTILRNGLYTLRLRTKDIIENTAVAALQVTVYNEGPDIDNLSASPNPFSPDESGTWIDLTTGEVFNEPGPNRILDDVAAVSFTASKAAFFDIRVFDAGGQLVRQLIAKPLYPDSQTKKISLEWNGRDNGGSFVRNGQYKLVVNAGAVEKEKFIMIGVNKKPFITGAQVAPNPFWPDGDGVDDNTIISYNLSENSYVTLEIYQGDTLIMKLLDSQLEASGSHSYSWDGKDAQGTVLPRGKYTLKISANAETGNIADPAYLDVFISFIANIHIPQDKLDPYLSEAAAIVYKLADERQISIKIYDSAGSLVRNLILGQSRQAGEHSESWDGKDDAGNIAPDGAYYFIIEDGQEGIIYDPRGTGGKDISKSLSLSVTEFNPLKNEFCVLTYTLPQAAKINLKVRYNRYSGPAVRVIKYQEPTASGQYQTLWDGRDESGNFVSYADFTFGLWGYTLDENSILITGGRPQIKSASISPIGFSPGLNPYSSRFVQKTTLTFDLSRQAQVTVNIYNSAGSLVRTLLNDALYDTGKHSFIWDGKDDQGRFLAADYYRVVIQAHNGQSYSEPLTLHSEIYY